MNQFGKIRFILAILFATCEISRAAGDSSTTTTTATPEATEATTEAPACALPPIEYLNSSWVHNNGRGRRPGEKWYVPISSKLQTWIPKEGSDNSTSGQDVKTTGRRCWAVSIFSPMGRVHVPLVCGFERHEQQSCSLKTERTRLKNKLRLFGDFTVTKTDNATYVVMAGCIQDDAKFWFVLSKKRTLPDAITDAILAHIEEIGYDRNDVSDKIDDRFSLHKLRATRCRKRDYPDYDGFKDKEDEALLMGKNNTGSGQSASGTKKTATKTTNPSPKKKKEDEDDKDNDKDDFFLSALVRTVRRLLKADDKKVKGGDKGGDDGPVPSGAAPDVAANPPGGGAAPAAPEGGVPELPA